MIPYEVQIETTRENEDEEKEGVIVVEMIVMTENEERAEQIVTEIFPSPDYRIIKVTERG